MLHNVGTRTTIKLKVSREDVRVEFFDQSCSWRDEGITRLLSKPGILSFLNQLQSKAEISVEVPEFPAPLTSPHKVSVRLLPMDGQPPGPATPLTLLPTLEHKEENMEEQEDSYFAMLRRTTDNIPSKPEVLRPVKEENSSDGQSNNLSEEEFKKASQRALIKNMLKPK